MAIIINNETYQIGGTKPEDGTGGKDDTKQEDGTRGKGDTKQEHRTGGEVDVKNLKRLYEELGFQVEEWKDLEATVHIVVLNVQTKWVYIKMISSKAVALTGHKIR